MALLLRFARHGQRISKFSFSQRLFSISKTCLEKEETSPRKPLTRSIRISSQTPQQNLKQDYQSQRLDNRLAKLDTVSRRMGRIAIKDVEELFSEIKTAGTATSSQSLLAIRCCGNLLPDEKLETRTKLVNDIWNTLEKLGCPLDVSHYNGLLKVYLENEHKFNPTDFLANMESKNINPNRVTYQRLVAHYCQQGNISGAGKILEYMKKQELPINENVFNALITGHARDNDMESAKGILEVMRNAKLEPSSETYATLLYAYAEKGDIESMREVFQEIESQDVFLLDVNYLEIIYILAKNGYSQHIDEIIKKLRRFAGFNQDATSVILRLVNCGEDEVAYKILKTMPTSATADGNQAPTGNFMIRQLVRVERPVEKILKFCEELKEKGLNVNSLNKATEMALLYGKVDHALAFIKEMKSQNLPVRCHYFWPILVQLKNNNAGDDKIFEVVDLMMAIGSPANYATFSEYVYPAISTSDYKTLTTKFKDMGYTTGAVVSPLVDYLVTQDKVQLAASVLDDYIVRLNSASLIRPLAMALKNTGDLQSSITILYRMTDSAERETQGKPLDVIGQFVAEYCHVVDKNLQLITGLLEELVKKNFKISQEFSDAINNYLKTPDGDVVRQLLAKLTSSSGEFVSSNFETSSIPQPREMSVSDLEAHLIELKSKNMNTRGVLRKLLLAHCRARNLERVEALKAELDSQNFTYSAGMYAQLLDLYVQNNQLEQSKKFLEEIQKNQPDFQLDDHKIMNFAALLVKEDKFDEALKFIKEQEVNPISSKSEMSAWRLLNASAEKGKIEETQKLFDAILERNFCEPTNAVLGPLVKTYILNNDITGAIAKFEECCKKYRATPWRNQLFALLIEKEDPDNLQKVMDLNTEVHGEMNTLHDLAFTFLECGRYREARKILESSGLRARHARLDSQCERLIEDNKVKELEELVSMTKELFDIDRDRMYYFLLRAYKKNQNHAKALGVWTSLQEEDIQPSDRTLIFLAEILRENGQPVPFSVPEIQTSVKATTQVAKETASTPLLQAVLDNNLDKALEIKQSAEADGNSITDSEIAILTEGLVRQERLSDAVKILTEALNKNASIPSNIIRFLCLRLANAGDVESIRSFESKFTNDMKRNVQFNNVLLHAYVNSGRHLEILDIYEKNVNKIRNSSPGAAMLSLLEKHPDLSDRVEKLAEDYAKHEEYSLLNVIWQYHFAQENYEKANGIFNSTPHFRTSLSFKKILEQGETTKNETMVKKLLDIVSASSLPPNASARVYSSLVEIQCANEDFDTAEATYKEATAKKVDHLLNRSTVLKLRAALQKIGKDIAAVSTSQ